MPLMGRAIERSLLADGGGTLVLADVFLVCLATPRALGEAAVCHRRVVFHNRFLRLIVCGPPGIMCYMHKRKMEVVWVGLGAMTPSTPAV